MNLPLPPGLVSDTATAAVVTSLSRQHDQEALLTHSLQQLLGGTATPIDTDTLAPLRQALQWMELGAGQVLMRQGEPGEAMYITISGRLRAQVHDEEGGTQRVREMARGQVIGEMSLITDEPRSATVTAVRDSVLVRLDKTSFQQLQAAGGPLAAALSNALTRQLVRRLRQDDAGAPAPLARPVTMSVLAASPGADLRAFTERLAQALRALQVGGQAARVRVIDAAAVDAALQQPGLAHAPLADASASRRVALWLDHVETQCDFVLLLADAHASPWTERCNRHGDECLLLADALKPPALQPPALQPPALQSPARPGEHAATTGAASILVLLHPADTAMPRNTAAWLACYPAAQPLHLRQGHAGDLARLARIQARQATGLVLAGGGARGLAHLGVWRALRERGIEVDIIGGTSIGAVMAALMATDRSYDDVLAVARRAFGSNPTGDFNWLPLLSLIQGRRLKRVIDTAALELAGAAVDIEDLWKPFFCVAANYTRACEQVLQRGPLAKLVRASLSIPGALPPVVVAGELLCDGGTFNNFPVDVMRGMRGVGRVIGVDLSTHKPRLVDFEDVPSPWALARDRLRPRGKRRYRLPSLTAYLMNVTILYSNSRQRQARRLTDLHFNPPLERVGMLQWNRLDQIVEQGYEHALKVLGTPPA
jgi:NTE family protein